MKKSKTNQNELLYKKALTNTSESVGKKTAHYKEKNVYPNQEKKPRSAGRKPKKRRRRSKGY